MAAFLHDTFTTAGASSELLTAHVPEIGGAWISANGLLGTGSAIVRAYPTDNEIRLSSGTAYGGCYNDLMPPSADVKIVANLGRALNNAASNAGVLFRLNPSTNTGYRFHVIGVNRVQLFRVVSGVSTSLYDTTTTGTGLPTSGSVPFEINCSNDHITVSRNGVVLIDLIDPSPITANGYIGVTVGGGLNTEISAEDLAGAPVVTTGTSDGIATVIGISEVVRATTGTIAAAASSNFISQTFRTGYGQSIGSATVNGIGIAISFAESTGAIAAGATVSGVGRSIREGVGIINASATSEWTAVGLSVGESEGTIAAGATVNGVGERVFNTRGTSSGQTSSAMVGRSIADTTGLIEGLAEVLGVGAAFDLGMTDGTIEAGATVTGVGGMVINTVGTIAGSATVTGKIVTGSISRINGRATVTGRSLQIRSTIGTAAGSTDSNMIGSQFEGSQGVARGSSEVMGVGEAVVEVIGSITGTSDSNFLSYGVTLFVTPASRTIELAAEDRAIVVRAEDRSFIVPRSDRSAEAELETRTIEVLAEVRSFAVAAEDRTLTVTPEDREIIL